MLLQPHKSDFIIYTITEVEENESISHWSLMKNSEINTKQKNKDGNIKNILSIWYFKCKRLPAGISMKQKSRICGHGRIQQWGVNLW